MELFYIFYTIIAITSWSCKVYATQSHAYRGPIEFFDTCATHQLHEYGRKVYCENKNEQPISCYDEVKNLTAYITCDKWYYDEKNIKSQIVHCVNRHTWSEPLLECSPKCDKYPANMKIFGPENTKSFKWYVELVRKTPKAGKPDIYKGIILNEEDIYIDDAFCSNEDAHNFVGRFYNPGGDFKDHALIASSIQGDSSSCIAFLDKSEYIRFNNDHKPVCPDSFDIGFPFQNSVSPDIYDKKGCYVPYHDTEKFEVKCFQYIDERTKKVQCSKYKHEIVLKRCQLGYESQTPLTNTKNFYISKCQGARWSTEHLENDCVLTCGEVDKEYIPPSTPLLFRGNHIDILSAPWHVGIYYKKGDNINQICGGTIIHTNIIISAAHCFYDDALKVVKNSSSYLVAAGKKYRSFDAFEKNAAFADVKEVFIPPNYLAEKQQNDLAILILDRHFNYSSHIKPVCVDWKSYTDSDIPKGTKGRVVGWGATSFEEESSTELQTISLKTLTRRQCERRVDPNNKDQITGDKFCAVNENNATACRGDSGGGFVVKKKFGSTERYVLAGIVSLGVDYKKYCADGFLTLFTNIQLYKDMIQEYISEVRDIEYLNSDLH